MNHSISLTVNGARRDFVLDDPRVTLLDLLRERLHLTGTKKGCDRGQCGACTILVDGKRINSCLALAVSHDGAEIVTIEGIGQDAVGRAVQNHWVETDVVQCGYCQSGQIMAAVALLKQTTKPTDQNIDESMGGNICRCATYPRIREAIKNAAAELTKGGA